MLRMRRAHLEQPEEQVARGGDDGEQPEREQRRDVLERVRCAAHEEACGQRRHLQRHGQHDGQAGAEQVELVGDGRVGVRPHVHVLVQLVQE